jgi:hypothetical protein
MFPDPAAVHSRDNQRIRRPGEIDRLIVISDRWDELLKGVMFASRVAYGALSHCYVLYTHVE